MPIDQEVFDSQIKMDRFPFPCKGDVTLGVRNANYTLGPVMLQLAMKPGAFIPAHVHKNVAEVLYILEGDFTNDGSPTKPAQRCTSRQAACTVRTPRRKDAGCSSFGRNAPRMRPPTSAISSLLHKQQPLGQERTLHRGHPVSAFSPGSRR